MKEDFLHYVWKYKLFNALSLETTEKEKIKIEYVGTQNYDSGPDFFNAKLHIDEQLWAGNVEIHLNSSDWYAHNHETDSSYDNVILHVVWNHDSEIFRENNSKIPTLELKDLVGKELLENYNKIQFHRDKWIVCENEISSVSNFTFSNWLERLYFERLEQKSFVIREYLEKTKFDWEAVLFKMLAKNFGLKANADAFLNLANSFDFSILRKESAKLESLESLLFGQAGMLNEPIEDVTYKKMQKEYAYLRTKYGIQPIFEGQVKFFRLRPVNFPTIRLSQLANLYHREQNLFSKLMDFTEIEEYYNIFTVETSAYWKSHYTFKTESSKSQSKKLTKAFIDLLLINTVIPFRFVYLNHVGKFDEDEILRLAKGIKAEKNRIISKFEDLNVDSENSYESQALIQLKNYYCENQRCLHCQIGDSLIRGK
ncbi:DUF2851 family protein [Aureivirga sp. CE67]|uniref:DUF2851 family protein n=1 Tax=Aureivirga sp. CE67 TaxID=1788983 RepID=UPI0018CA6E0D|nr:DUF2851 family protein [Aureivirga sp. CE67]